MDWSLAEGMVRRLIAVIAWILGNNVQDRLRGDARPSLVAGALAGLLALAEWAAATIRPAL